MTIDKKSLFGRIVAQCKLAGLITATETTPGDVEENAKRMDLVDEPEPPNRRIRDPYDRWSGRGIPARGAPIPIDQG